MSQVAEVSTPPRDGDDDAPFDGLRLRRLTKEFANFTAVRTLDLDVPSGSFFALLGPSGCGKTTTLRMVAGLETPTSGTIQLGDRDITWDKPYKRPVNTVFQNYALFPHLDIFENVAFGLRRRKDKGVDEQVRQMLDLVELDSQARKKPAQLSGGQQQRVALARALINRPEVLLLDEPLGALDLKLRRRLQLELKRIQVEVGITFVYVTHDQEEALTMSDRIAIMNTGKVEQLGTPEELYERPTTRFVADFIGTTNLLHGKVEDDGTVRLSSGELAPCANQRLTPGSEVDLSVRPESIRLVDDDTPLGLRGTVDAGGAVRLSTGELAPCSVGALAAGSEVELSVRPESISLVPAEAIGAIRGSIEQAAYLGNTVSYQVRTSGGLVVSVLAPKTGIRLPAGSDVAITWPAADALVLGDRSVRPLEEIA